MQKGKNKGVKPPKAFDIIPPEEARAIQKKGAIASAEARRKRKKLKEELELLLEIVDKKGVTNQTKISLALIKEAKNGNVKAFETIRDTVGEKPIDKQEVQQIDMKWFKADDTAK